MRSWLPFRSRPFARDLLALLTSLREANRDRLLAARDLTALATFAAAQGTALAPTHCPLDILACTPAVLSSSRSTSRCFGHRSCSFEPGSDVATSRIRTAWPWAMDSR